LFGGTDSKCTQRFSGRGARHPHHSEMEGRSAPRLDFSGPISVDMDDLALKREFFHVFPQLVDVFVESLVSEYGLTREVQDRTSRMIHYNVSGGKCNRGLSVLIGTRDLCREKKLDFADRIASAAVLGWAIEFVRESCNAMLTWM